MSATPKQGGVLRLEMPACYEYLNVVAAGVGACITEATNAPDVESITYSVQLAVQEACTNIIAHAYEGCEDGRIEVTVRQEEAPRRLVIDLLDRGAPFDPDSVPPPDLSGAHTHGYGLFLMRSLLDSVEYARKEDCNHWRLIKEF